MTRTKQAAMKSSGKGKNVEPSSSAATVADIPKTAKKRSVLAERGFSAQNPSADFVATVKALGWEKFVLHRKEYIPTLVHDFYKGIKERNDGELATISVCRHEEVKFNARAINDYYGLGYYGKAIETKCATYGKTEMNEVLNRICVEGAKWERSGDNGKEFKVLKSYLCEEASMWFSFIRHSLLPTGHTLWVDKERLLVIDAIMSREKVEVGRLINREINGWQKRKDSSIYFPCLITDLCMEAQVEIDAGELREEPSGAFPTKYKPRKKAANATASVDSATLQRLVEQQDSLAKFVKAHVVYQRKINAQYTKGKSTIPEPVMPDWMMEGDEDDEDEVPLASLHLRAVKKEKAKRMRSPVSKKKSPAKKKQKKVVEEELRSSDLDDISEEDEEETKKVSMEVLSDEDEEDTNKHETIPPPSNPTPPPKEQPPATQNPPLTQDLNKPSQSTENEPAIKAQQQPLSQGESAEDATASEAANTEEENVPEPPPKKTRVKAVMTTNPVGRKKRTKADVVEQGVAEPEVEEEGQNPKAAASKRTKLQVKKDAGSKTGKPATATSGAFITASKDVASAAVSTKDATASTELEVEKATVNPAAAPEKAPDAIASAEREAAEKLAELQATKAHDAAVERAKNEALEEATQSLAEHLLKKAQDAAVVADISAATTESGSGAIASDDVVVADPEDAAVPEEAERKKPKKKKGAQSSAVPTRQSGRTRSGAINK